MTNYRVTWEIDVEADSHHEAAEQALAIQRNPDSIATVFDVRWRSGEDRPAPGKITKTIDLNPEFSVVEANESARAVTSSTALSTAQLESRA